MLPNDHNDGSPTGLSVFTVNCSSLDQLFTECFPTSLCLKRGVATCCTFTAHVAVPANLHLEAFLRGPCLMQFLLFYVSCFKMIAWAHKPVQAHSVILQNFSRKPSPTLISWWFMVVVTLSLWKLLHLESGSSGSHEIFTAQGLSNYWKVVFRQIQGCMISKKNAVTCDCIK